jgi:hypothetical protein
MHNNQLIDLFERVINFLARIPILPILVLFSLLGSAAAFFMISNPGLTIEIQRRFYAKINWKIEPISMQKEIHNTRIMGYLLIILLIIILIFTLLNKTIFL